MAKAAELTKQTDGDELSLVFGALADPTRRAILERLRSGDASVTDLARPFSISMPAVTRHLKVLERAGLVQRLRDAQWRPCRLHAEPLGTANRWMEQYRHLWEQRFNNLSDYLDRIQRTDTEEE